MVLSKKPSHVIQIAQVRCTKQALAFDPVVDRSGRIGARARSESGAINVRRLAPALTTPLNTSVAYREYGRAQQRPRRSCGRVNLRGSHQITRSTLRIAPVNSQHIRNSAFQGLCVTGCACGRAWHTHPMAPTRLPNAPLSAIG